MTAVREIRGIGEKTEKLLKRLNIETVEDLIHHYPRCYLIYEDPVPISRLAVWERCSVAVRLDSPVNLSARGKRKVCTCLVKDDSGSLFMRWYNMPYLRRTLRQGETYIFTGVPVFKAGRLMMEQAEISTPAQYREKRKTFQPVYPLTAGLSNKQMQKAIRGAFSIYDSPDYLPETVKNYYSLENEEKALYTVHFPEDEETLLRARERVIFDEFFRFFVSMELVRERAHKTLNRYLIPMDDRVREFINGLPFALTGAQEKALEDIRNDFSGTTAMNRLVQGDVGSGKTIIAVISVYAAVLAGYQAAMMAPTEVLAEQHYDSFRTFLGGYGIRCGLLTGSARAGEKRKIRQELADGNIDVIIGTHALIQETVDFARLALVITDEQHRFGVRQRDALMKKGEDPHVLVMSATPIPRTLGIILYRDLDVSIVNELPANRLPIKNSVVGQAYRPAAWNFLQKQVSMGHQAYVICPMITDEESVELESVENYTKMLTADMPPSVRISSLYGKLPAAQKNEIMKEFAGGEIDILVSTTVIEVGIDVPNATVMLIENAERFGLAQLHQLRGRVGRGSAQSYCIFISGTDEKEAMDRLAVIGHSNDGFHIANEDLRLRGPGDLFGTRQSGTMDFALGDIYANADVLKMASEAVTQLREDGFNFHELYGYGISDKLNYAQDI
ncbi:MAG: ATP-dependent DNA helicase RecG [Eubacterium sp.]|nr:ATP-dependent DNA helicase RecG [Eubacterium sp.]